MTLSKCTTGFTCSSLKRSEHCAALKKPGPKLNTFCKLGMRAINFRISWHQRDRQFWRKIWHGCAAEMRLVCSQILTVHLGTSWMYRKLNGSSRKLLMRKLRKHKWSNVSLLSKWKDERNKTHKSYVKSNAKNQKSSKWNAVWNPCTKVFTQRRWTKSVYRKLPWSKMKSKRSQIRIARHANSRNVKTFSWKD